MSSFAEAHNAKQPPENVHMAKKCHFCVVVNQWCCGSTASGKPDDCIDCGRCKDQQD
jgi:hypothetical protein